MTPFSEIEARAHGDLAEVWEAVLEARRGHLAGGGAIEASEGTPILEWTLGELSRLDPESNPAQKLSPEIMVKVGWAATAGQAARDETGPALRWYRKAVSLGGAEAIFELAKAYDDNPDAHENNSEFVRGLAVSKSGSEAVRLYAIAAEAGLVKAQLNLCVSYHHGEGVKRSYAKAFQWCEKAGAQGNAKAQLYVGDAYYHGRGVKRDLVKSVDWYLLAAGNGSAEAWLELGYAYEKGEGAQEDLEEAFSCYSLAANAGLPDAQYNLAELLYFGRGTEKDEEKAFEWYAKAAEGGSPEAKIRLAEKRSR